MTRRILVTGSRTAKYHLHAGQVLKAFADYENSELRIARTWGTMKPYDRNLVIVHGDARGLDTVAKMIAEDFGHRTEAHPAEWDDPVTGDLNKRAGFIRNQKMVDLGAEVCLAFKVEGQRFNGTSDCAMRAQRAGIPVVWTTLSALPAEEED